MVNLVWQLFWGFVKVGVLGYGGGPGSISLIQVVAVDGYHWLDNNQFAEILAIGNALPGPIATKMAAAIGWRTGGVLGAAAALIGVVLPSLVLMLGLYQLLLQWRSNPYVQGLIQGVKPIVLVLLVGLVLDFIPLTVPKGTRSIILTAGFFVVGFVAIRWLKVSPVWVIVGSMAAGALFMRS
jgi:chromate transporter